MKARRERGREGERGDRKKETERGRGGKEVQKDRGAEHQISGSKGSSEKKRRSKKKETQRKSKPMGGCEADRNSPNSKNHFVVFRYNFMKINNLFYLQGVLSGSLFLITKIA